MKRPILLAACAAAAVAGCVSVQNMPDPRGALGRSQRLIVAVYPAPGPWIIGAADSKAEAAAKISPLGFLVQTAENEHTNSVSKNLQQYLPRPKLGEMTQNALLESLTAARSTTTVQTALQAGIFPAQLAEWNKSKDQLDWRLRYYAPDPDQPAPRDYAKILTLDDALILDVNVSYGTDASDDGALHPTMSAASRVFRGDTAHLLWEHEDVVADQVSSATMTDFQVQPWMLTDALQRIAPTLGKTVAASFLKAFAVAPGAYSPQAVAGASGGGGLVPMSFFQNASSATVVVSTPVISGPTPVVDVSTPAVSASTAPGH
jgi:hypothetical protein